MVVWGLWKRTLGFILLTRNFVVFYQGCTPWIGQWTMGSEIMHTWPEQIFLVQNQHVITRNFSFYSVSITHFNQFIYIPFITTVKCVMLCFQNIFLQGSYKCSVCPGQTILTSSLKMAKCLEKRDKNIKTFSNTIQCNQKGELF